VQRHRLLRRPAHGAAFFVASPGTLFVAIMFLQGKNFCILAQNRLITSIESGDRIPFEWAIGALEDKEIAVLPD